MIIIVKRVRMSTSLFSKKKNRMSTSLDKKLKKENEYQSLKERSHLTLSLVACMANCLATSNNNY